MHSADRKTKRDEFKPVKSESNIGYSKNRVCRIFPLFLRYSSIFLLKMLHKVLLLHDADALSWLFSEHQYVSYLRSIKSSSGCKFLLRKPQKCTGRAKSWKNSKIRQKKLLKPWNMKIAKNKNIEGCLSTISNSLCWVFSSKTSQISVVIFFDITEFPSRTQFSLNEPIKLMIMDILCLLLIKYTLHKHSGLI